MTRVSTIWAAAAVAAVATLTTPSAHAQNPPAAEKPSAQAPSAPAAATPPAAQPPATPPAAGQPPAARPPARETPADEPASAAPASPATPQSPAAPPPPSDASTAEPAEGAPPVAPEAANAGGKKKEKKEEAEEKPWGPHVPESDHINFEKRPTSGGIHWKPGSGVVIQSDDGDFKLATRVRGQFYYGLDDEASAASEAQGVPVTGEPWAQYIQLRRSRVQFGGNYFGKNNKFKFELAFSPADVSLRSGQVDDSGASPQTSPLLDFYLDFTHLRDLSIRLGQSKVPFSRQRVISSGNLQQVDRSIVNGEFNVDRDIGVDIRSQDLFGLGMLRYYLGVYAGQGRNTTLDNEFGQMFLARVEVLPFGMFEDYSEVDFERTFSPRLSLGVGYGYIDRANATRGIKGRAPADGGTTNFHMGTWDFVFKFADLAIQGEGAFRDGTRNPGDAMDDAGMLIPVSAPSRGAGWMTQVGYMIPYTTFEVSTRFGFIEPTGDVSTMSAQEEYGVALSYYFAHHQYKIQADYFRLSEEPPGGPKYSWNQMRVQLQASF